MFEDINKALIDKKLIQNIINVVGETSVLLDTPMINHTSFKIGGPADVLIMPANINQIKEILNLCKVSNTPWIVIGNGTNLLVSDKGIRGAVIKLGDNFCDFSLDLDCIEALSGISLSKLSEIAYENSLTGFEFASGIPGTLGGAVSMNAGAYGGEIKDILLETTYLTQSGEIRTINIIEHKFGYRTSIIQKEHGIVLSSKIQLTKGDKNTIENTLNELRNKRQNKQPLDIPSAGSVFKRPAGFFTGKLIEDCGLRGFGVGGAQVSKKHCGFIVNTGNATAEDVLSLINYIKNSVSKEFGVNLETEIRILGDE